MESDLRNSLKMSDDDEEDFKNHETTKGGSGRRRTTRNESEKRRRDKLNIYINELASMVPTCAASQKKLNKTTILKMTVNYMRIHNDLTGSVLGKEYGLHMSFLSSGEVSGLLDESLNGFMFVLSRTGEIIYMSQSITQLLGYEVDQILGVNLIDFVHPEDKSIILYELRKDTEDVTMQSDLNGLHRVHSKPARHSFDVRFRCVPDRHYTNNQDLYEMVHIIGYTDTWETKKPSQQDVIVSGCNTVIQREQQRQILTEKPRCLVAVGLLTRPGLRRLASVNESTPVEFESRHTMDGKFLFVDPRSITLTGFWPYELLGTSLYSYIHHDDMQMLASVHQLLLEYGECKTEPYRMRSKGDQWLWMKSRSFISYNHWNSKPEFFCSTNVAVCNKDGMASLRERKKASLCNPHSMHTSIVPVRNNTSLYPQKNQQEASLMAPGLPLQQDNVVTHNAACKEIVPVVNNLTSNNDLPVKSRNNSSNGKQMSSEGSESQRKSCEDDSESTDSLDLTMSYEELEHFIEAQGQLHDQLMMKHTALEETINKQKQQLQAVQQQMLLNLQAQLTINPGANQEQFEEQFKRTKRASKLHEKQEIAQKELVQTLKERRRQTEKRNQRQLKYYHEKRMKATSDASSLPQVSHATTLDMRTNVEPESDNANVTVIEEKRLTNSVASMHGHTSAGVQCQVENIREGNQNTGPVPQSMQSRRAVQYPSVSGQGANQNNIGYASDGRQPVADGLVFNTQTGMPSFISEQEAVGRDFQALQQPVYPNVHEPMSQRRQQSFAALSGEKANLPNSFSPGFSPEPDQPPTTLSNIQSLLTASSQNPESMQKLLSGLSCQPDVAQTLLGLLKQAQTSGSSEQDSLLFDQSLQKTTVHFSSALGTGGTRNDSAQNLYQVENNQGLQKQQQSCSLRGTSTASARQNLGQQMQAGKRISSASRFSTSTWSGSSSSGDPSVIGPSFVQHTDQAPRNQGIERRPNEKQKDNKKDYFSNFSSQELEAMFLTSPPKPPPRTTAQSSTSREEAKLQEEQLLHSPLLIQQQQLLQMHQDQRKQLLVRQQEQLLMANQKHNQSPQQMNVPFVEDSQHSSIRSLLSDTSHPSTSTREQEQASTSNTPVAQSSASWDSLSSNNFELNEADEQVLNMLLAESSMDTLLDPSPWPETDNLLDYLNMNPDLTSD